MSAGRPSSICARLHEGLRGSLATFEDRAAGVTLALPEIHARACGVAHQLLERGLAGQALVIAHEPGLDWVVSFLGALYAGVIAVPVPISAPAPELAYLVADSRAAAAVASPSLAPLLPAALPLLSWATDGAQAPTAPDPPREEAAGLLLYTSGTTGRPKGAVITHANLSAQTAALREAWQLAPSDQLVHALPLHHLHGVVVALLSALTTPHAVVMLPRFDPAAVLAELATATVLMTVPTMGQRLLDYVDQQSAARREELSASARRLRLLTSGSAALPAKLAERWRAFAGVLPLERYGMTEIGMALSNPLDPAARKIGHVGAPLPSVEVRIVDDAGADGDGPGELWVRGPSVFAGYLGREQATREAFAGDWFKTGDVAQRVADGAIRLLGRKSSDILKTGGEKVSALEIEEVLLGYDAVAEVAVVGLPDEEWGDRVVAAVVARPGQEAQCTTELVRAWAKQRLPPYKVPRQVVVLEALPRNAMGKVQKSLIVTELGAVGAKRDPV